MRGRNARRPGTDIQATKAAYAASGQNDPDDATSLRSYMQQGSPSSNGRPREDYHEEGKQQAAARLVPAEDPAKKFRSFKVRTASTVIILGGFILFVWAGHVPLMFMVFLVQATMIKEAFELASMALERERLPGFRALQWYFFFVAVFYLYTRFIAANLPVEITSTKALARLFVLTLKRYTIISFFLYIAGFMMFVLKLKRGMYLYQFTQYAWTHMCLLVVIMPTTFFISNLFQGIIWFIIPILLIVVNDIFAYLAGFFFGRTPLILLSPKKTWEGFFGGFICTVMFAFYASNVMAQFKWLACPRKDLSLGALDCTPSTLFQIRSFSVHDLAAELPGPLEEGLQLLHSILPAHAWENVEAWRLTAMPLQLHTMIMACFASFIAPFGGFFASGFKRAFKLKDFGHSIPGHGGIGDRFDCQVLMAMFSYLYYWNYMVEEAPSIGIVLSEALRLSSAQQLELFVRLGNLLVGQGLIPDTTLDLVAPHVNLEHSN